MVVINVLLFECKHKTNVPAGTFLLFVFSGCCCCTMNPLHRRLYLFGGFDRQTLPVDLLVQRVVEESRLGHGAEQLVGSGQRSPAGGPFGAPPGARSPASRGVCRRFPLPTFALVAGAAAVAAVAQIVVAREEAEGAGLVFVRHFVRKAGS